MARLSNHVLKFRSSPTAQRLIASASAGGSGSASNCGLTQTTETTNCEPNRHGVSAIPTTGAGTVNLMYRWFIDDGLVEAEIANRLNGMAVRTDLDREWTRATVHEVLTNEKYIGNNVYNRISFKLKKLRVANTPDMWIKKEGAFEPIVTPDVFYTAQGIVRARAHRYTDEELIERLRNLYQHRGFLSGLVIDEAEGMPSTSVYSHRFGSLVRAYQMVGFTPDRDYRYLEINKFLRRFHPEIVKQTESQIAMLGGSVRRDPATDLLRINDEFSLSLVLARCQTPESGRHHWKVRFDTSLAPDITVAVRLDQTNEAARDYYLLPRLDFGQPRISLAERNAIEFESYRFDSLIAPHGLGFKAAAIGCARECPAWVGPGPGQGVRETLETQGACATRGQHIVLIVSEFAVHVETRLERRRDGPGARGGCVGVTRTNDVLNARSQFVLSEGFIGQTVIVVIIPAG